MKKKIRYSIKKYFFLYSVILFSMLFALPNVLAAETNLQQLIDQTPEGEVLELDAVTYEGNIVISKPISIIGKEGTRIKGDGTANVIEIESEEVTLDTIHVSHSGTSQSAEEEYSGIRIMADNVTLNNLTITDVFHGIYISRAQDITIDKAHIVGQKTESFAKQGNGIAVIRGKHTTITNSFIEKTRDGIFVEYADNNVILNNRVTETRYGLHYMYSDNNTFKENEFVGNIGGAAIMHSDHLLLENNIFSYNHGSRSFGLIVQSSRDLQILKNKFYLNQRGLYLEQATSNRIEENKFFKNQIGIELWTSSTAHTFIKNHFSNNNMDVATIGGKSFNEWFERGVGNFWHVPMFDLDDDGVGDSSYKYSSAIGSLIEENELAYLFLNSPAINIYEMTKSITSNQRIMAEDNYPMLTDQSNVISVWWIVLIFVILIGAMMIVKKRRAA